MFFLFGLILIMSDLRQALQHLIPVFLLDLRLDIKKNKGSRSNFIFKFEI
jgi:hypothetical protein